MNQKPLVVAMLVALMATAVVTLVPQAFAQVVDNGRITEDDDTLNVSSIPTKVKNAANCNLGGWANECDNESESEIEVEE
jgi:hypothetical protein